MDKYLEIFRKNMMEIFRNFPDIWNFWDSFSASHHYM